MKISILILSVFAFGASSAFAGHVNGHTRSNGTYVQGYERTNANNTTSDNYSTKGNTNPYTGQAGTKPDTKPAYGLGTDD